jgi:zinc protease
VAAGASAGYDLTSRLDTLFTLEAAPIQNGKIATLETAIRSEIQRLREQLVSPVELQRVKTQVISGHIFERDSLFSQAMQIGSLVTAGLDWRLKDQFVADVKAVTAEDIQSVARKYLVDDRLTVGVLEPSGERVPGRRSQQVAK